MQDDISVAISAAKTYSVRVCVAKFELCESCSMQFCVESRTHRLAEKGTKLRPALGVERDVLYKYAA